VDHARADFLPRRVHQVGAVSAAVDAFVDVAAPVNCAGGVVVTLGVPVVPFQPRFSP
jgi:hypothetical protein